MALNFQNEPFFDDYSEDSQFYRILFRPGYAVQARELTQLQTILQNQISRNGDNIFKEGSMVVPGQISYDLNADYVKLAFDAGVDSENILSSLVGKEIKNAGGLIAKVIAYTVAEGDDLDTIFVKYQNSIQDEAGNNISTFIVNDTLTPVDESSGLTTTVADTLAPTGKGCTATIQRGIYYIKKNYVLVQDQIIILDKYTNTPSYRIGLKLVEDIVYPEQDESLLDNAQGAPNYAAPGACRYYMDLVLTKLAITQSEAPLSIEEDFIDLLRIENGLVKFKIDHSTYAEIEKTMARRTYDQAGDYALNPFNIQVREYRNNLRGNWAASEKFIQGDLIKVSDGGSGFWYFVATTNGVSGQNRPTFDSNADYVTDNQVTWEYQIFPNFNQGINTFTAGSDLFTDFTVNDHIRLSGMLALGVEAGKAYVRGFEIQKLATEYVPIQKSRYLPAGSDALCAYFGVDALPAVTDSISTEKTTSIDVSMGSYVLVNTAKYLPDISTLSTINLHSALYASADNTTIIGTARIRAMENHDNAGTYKLFVFDINMNAGKTFSSVKSFYNDGTHFKANTVQTDGVTVLQSPGLNSLIWELPDYAIKDITEATYSVVVPFTRTASGGGISLSAPSGYTFESINDVQNYIIVDVTGNGDIVSNAILAIGSGGDLSITNLTNTHQYSVFATMKRSQVTSPQVRRTVTDATPQQITSKTIATAPIVELNNSYVTRIVSVMMSTHVDAGVGKTTWNSTPVYSVNITNRYTFNSNQDPNSIKLSTIALVPGASVPSGPIMIKYEYLASVEVSPGDFIGVNSYTHSTSKMTYDQITTIGSYTLRDCIDFRPYRIMAGYQARYFPKYGTTAAINYTNHLSRIDNIVLTNAGDYIETRGVPSAMPIEPSVPDNSMKLAQISVEPYTFTRGDKIGCAISRTENKRYTMRDIGKLERRISDLEYYTSLSLTEMDTKNMNIVDSSGLTRYQNGFLVDSFDGQGVGNAASDDWNASVDSTNKELRPFFDQKQVNLLENVNASTKNYKVSGDLVTLPFTEVPLIIQNKASLTVNVNPYALYTWTGIVSINPWSDTWFSTHHRPDIIINDEGQYNAVVAKANADGVLGTIWNSWQKVFSSTKSLETRMQNIGTWSTADTEILNASNNGGSFWRNRNTFTVEELDFIGNTNHNIGSAQANSVAGSRVITIETDAVETTSTRVGTRSFIVDKVDSRVVDDRVVDTQVVPYIRPRAVLFNGYGFKPSTAMYGFFDNILVNDYITSATRLQVTPITGYSSKFDTERNAGSAVSNPERTVWYSDGVEIAGTIDVVNGSATVNGTATAFLQQVVVGDLLNLGDATKHTVTAITDNYTLTISPAYTGVTASDVSAKVIGPTHTTEEVEVAFNHGEVIKEYVNGVATGNSAIVVGQETYNANYYIYVLNVKGSGIFSTASNSYLKGEYTGTGGIPRVKFVNRTDFSSLTTSFTGQLNGIFNIPSSPSVKFRTGTRELKFSDSPVGDSAVRAAQQSTSGGAFYEAQGLVEVKQRTIISTRTADIVSTQVSATNTVVTTTDRLTRDTGWFDPLAETFMVQQEGGAFITSVDLFFQSADPKIPVRIEIREVVNGYPGSVVLPFSRVEKKGSQVNISADSSLATTFKFVSPVFLQNGTEYALVVLSDSNNYNLWVSQTDTIDVLSQVRISSQPYNGVLFKSQNSTAWTADQTQDLKFVIRRAEFSTAPVTIELIPPPLGYTNLGFNPFNFITGSRKCRVEHPNHGMVAGEYVMFKTRQIIDSINGISKQYIFDTALQILSAELDFYVVEFGGSVNSSASGRVGGGYITATSNYEFETAMIDIAEVVPPGTSITYDAKVINHADQVSTYRMTVKENTMFEDVKVYPASVNYSSTEFPSGLAVVATLTPAPGITSVSPVIDLSRLAMTMVSNKVDAPGLDIIDITLDKFPITSVDSGTGADIGTEIGEGKPIDLISLVDGETPDTLVINSLSEPILYENMNNNLNAGDVLRFTYSDITDAVRDMVIVNKSYDGEGNLYFTVEAFNGSSILSDTADEQTVVIWWLSHFKSEYASTGGSTTSKYVTKKINFSRPSEMLRIMFSAIIPNDAEVEIYYKTGLSVSGDFIAGRYHKATPNSYTKSDSVFSEINADIENIDAFDSVIIKLVMKSINKAAVPRIQDFRVIACAA